MGSVCDKCEKFDLLELFKPPDEEDPGFNTKMPHKTKPKEPDVSGSGGTSIIDITHDIPAKLEIIGVVYLRNLRIELTHGFTHVCMGENTVEFSGYTANFSNIGTGEERTTIAKYRKCEKELKMLWKLKAVFNWTFDNICFAVKRQEGVNHIVINPLTFKKDSTNSSIPVLSKAFGNANITVDNCEDLLGQIIRRELETILLSLVPN